MINVTKPFLPPLEEYHRYTKEIWDRVWLTNDGPLVRELEQKLKDYLEIDHVLFLGNGTIALQIALQALEISGEVITTPFSYVATTSTIVWEKCTPVFSDIDPETLNIDPAKIESKITARTTAIMATHVFGNPCDIEMIRSIADKHNLKVIYDAAHCFGSLYKGKSVFEYGDVSTASFHATKLFHTTEGGAVMTSDDRLNFRMSKMRNFGHDGPGRFNGVGINGKNSEFHAAMGLCNLKYVDSIIEKRKQDYQLYQENLKNQDLQFLKINEHATFNHSYFPVILPSEETLLQVLKGLNDEEIFPRRYFYPSLNKLGYVDQVNCPISEDISNRILCLPMYFELETSSIDMICGIIEDCLVTQKA